MGMELILLIGLVVLAMFHYRLATHVQALEREVDRLSGDSPASAEPLPDPFFEALIRARPTVRAPIAPAERVAEPEPGPEEEPASEEEPADSFGGGFERLVGGRLLIWIGGIALAAAGLFMVRYSIEIGLITPPVRMAMAAVFGLLLVAAGEYARSRPDGAIDLRVAQSLVGAGVLVLYAAAYGSHVLYDLLSMRTASVLMVAVTVAALFLALRHGAPAAAMGLVGGFLTPLLVGNPSETSIPLLTYLALLNLALFALAGRRGWTWLAASAVVLSFAWTAVLVFLEPGQALPAGFFIVLLSVAASALRAGGGWELDFLRPAAIGLIQIAILVGRTDLGLAAWGLFGLLSLACFFLAARRPEYRFLPAMAVTLALLLLFMKAVDVTDVRLPAIAGAITLMFGLGGAAGAVRGARALSSTGVTCAGIAGPAMILRLFRPELLLETGWGLLFALLALGPLALAWLRRAPGEEEGRDGPRLLAAATAALLAAAAAAALLPDPLLGPAWLAIAAAAAFASRRLDDGGLGGLALLVAAVAVVWSASMVPTLWSSAYGSLLGNPVMATDLPRLGLLLQALVLAIPFLFALARLVPPDFRLRSVPFAAACLFAAASAYVLFKQVFHLSSPTDFEVWAFAERTLLNQILFLLGWLVCTGKLPLPGLDKDQRWLLGVSLTALAAARLVWFDMLIHNPAFVAQNVGAIPVLNLLLPAYLLSAFWLYRARRGADHAPRSSLWLLLFLAALTVGVALMVRQLFHGAILSALSLPAAESYGYSLAGLLLSVALLLWGFRLGDKGVRLAGLLLLTATILKVFILDAAALDGVLRILSFLGLGSLVLVGKLYSTVLRAEAGARKAQA